jgi:hypothetical protein
MPGDPGWATHTFFLSGDGVRYLGSGLSLVDAGDYDADGAAEVLFWSTGYNDDGYVLFYDGLSRHAEFFWSYH